MQIEAPKIVITADEIEHSGPLAAKQNYAAYTEQDHLVWETLYKQQFSNLEEIAYSKWLGAIGEIGLSKKRLPKLTDVASKLSQLTGWTPIPVSGFLAIKDYFWYIATKQFPTVTTIRAMKDLEFVVEPDLFHDAFGHLPMHSLKSFADFVALFGRVAYELIDNALWIQQMNRLYWFTVEYALIRENGKIKVCGSGHMSGIKESRYSLTDIVIKKPFVLEDVVNQDYNPHILQPILFVLESYDQVSEALAKEATKFGVKI